MWWIVHTSSELASQSCTIDSQSMYGAVTPPFLQDYSYYYLRHTSSVMHLYRLYSTICTVDVQLIVFMIYNLCKLPELADFHSFLMFSNCC